MVKLFKVIPKNNSFFIKMPIMFEKKVLEAGGCKIVILPKNWAEDKENIGVIGFDLSKKDERKIFFDFKERLIEIQS